MAVVVETARELHVPLHRISQGSGVMMLTDDEIRSMAQLGSAEQIEVGLFIGPRASWDVGSRPDTVTVGARTRGEAQLTASIHEADRAVDLGIRLLLVADEGLLWTFHLLRERGRLPADLRLKVSALASPGNSVAFRVLERLGADSINIHPDLPIGDIASIRESGIAAIDFYVESPDDLGGYVRMYDIPELVRVARPIYLKFGLRNATGVYPAGRHLRSLILDASRERVRRARLGLDLLERLAPGAPASPVPAWQLTRPPRFANDLPGDPTPAARLTGS
jgi:hypothetical protein